MRIALDTNVLACAEGADRAIMRDRALKLIQRLPPGAVVLPVQTLGELFHVLVRKAKRRPSRAREAVLSLARRVCSGRDVRLRNRQRNGSGVRSWPRNLGLGRAGRVGGGRVSFAPVGRSPGRLYVAWSHRHQPVRAHASSDIGGIAHGAPGVNPYAGGTDARLKDPSRDSYRQ